jgi:hypothetical protein
MDRLGGGGIPVRALVLSFLALLLSNFAYAAEPMLKVAVGGETRSFTREAMLAIPEAATVEVAKDMTYGVPMTYRAVPVASLLAGLTLPPDSVIEAVAIDGFAAQLPLDLPLNTDASKVIALGRDRARRSTLARSPVRSRAPALSTLCGRGLRPQVFAASTGPIRRLSS